MPYSRPLLATDLSDGSRPAAAALHAFLAPGKPGRAVLVLPYPDLPTHMPREVREDVMARVEGRRMEAEAVLREWLKGTGVATYEALVRYGPVARTIGREAESADLLVLGSTGLSRVERVLLGSVARNALRRVACDTYLARPLPTGVTAPRRILFATDFHASGRAAADQAAEIAQRTGAQVQLLHVIDPGIGSGLLYPSAGEMGYDTSDIEKYAVDELHRLNLERFDGKADERIARGRAASAIVSAAGSFHADLVVVGSHGEGLASRILLGSVAESVAELAPCSVLVVRPHRMPVSPRGGTP